MSHLPYEADGDGVRLRVRVTPRAKRSEIAGIVEDAEGSPRLAVRLAAPPVEGAANKALLAFLAATLGVPRSAIEIASGEASRLKTVRLRGVSPAALAAKL